MKQIKFSIVAIFALAIFITAFSFKPRVFNMKLYQCKFADNKCEIFNSTKNYKADVNGVLFSQAVLRLNSNPPVNMCQVDCPNDIKVSIEP